MLAPIFALEILSEWNWSVADWLFLEIFKKFFFSKREFIFYYISIEADNYAYITDTNKPLIKKMIIFKYVDNFLFEKSWVFLSFSDISNLDRKFCKPLLLWSGHVFGLVYFEIAMEPVDENYIKKSRHVKFNVEWLFCFWNQQINIWFSNIALGQIM